MASLNFTPAAAYQAYVEEFAPELFSKLYYGFETAKYVTSHEGVKGRKVLTELIVGSLAKRWRKQFDALPDAIEFKPRVLQTELAKVDLQMTPQEFEGTYLGMMRRTGQNQKDLPFEAYILDKVIQKLHTEMESAIWQGEAAAIPAAGDDLDEVFDGYLKIIADAITASDITEFPTGALTNENIVEKVEDMWDALDPAMKRERVEVWMSYSNYVKYVQNYREDFGKYVGYDGQGAIKLDFGNAVLRPIAGMGNSNRVIITQPENFHYGLDAASDKSMINFEWNHRSLDMWIDFRIGAQIGILDDSKMIIVNNQA